MTTKTEKRCEELAEELVLAHSRIAELEKELATWKEDRAYHMTSPIHGAIDTRGLERHEG